MRIVFFFFIYFYVKLQYLQKILILFKNIEAILIYILGKYTEKEHY